ncbi:MAG TPA: DUF3972 domain-containing protein [Nitratifractor sp.]|nr:DUF3972 domain-containing protein [Nitratifractor sp.]
MSKLIKPSEYAKQCGISRQAVYVKIKKGLLKSKKVDGQIFIELDDSVDISQNQRQATLKAEDAQKDLIGAKDETIKILKETISDLKETNNLIVGTLKGEVDLLKSAFGEMQQLYRTQIEHLKIEAPMQVEHKKDPLEENNFIELKDLARDLELNKTERKKFKRAAKELKESGDFRFIEIDDEIYALKDADYSDFIEALKLLRK